MNAEYLTALARHILTAVGGFVIARGWVDSATMETIAGGVVALIGVIWSIFHKKQVIAKQNALIATFKNASEQQRDKP